MQQASKQKSSRLEFDLKTAYFIWFLLFDTVQIEVEHVPICTCKRTALKTLYAAAYDELGKFSASNGSVRAESALDARARQRTARLFEHS
jgi:hypothetical protein